MSLFEKIRDSEEPADIVYKDEYVTAFDDKYPDAPVHVLIIPNKTIKSLDAVTDEDELHMGKILLAASKIAKIKNICEKFFYLVMPNSTKLYYKWGVRYVRVTYWMGIFFSPFIRSEHFYIKS